MDSRDGILIGSGQGMRYSDWMWTVVVVFKLDMGNRDGVLTGIGQERWCTDRIWLGDMVYHQEMGRRYGILIRTWTVAMVHIDWTWAGKTLW